MTTHDYAKKWNDRKGRNPYFLFLRTNNPRRLLFTDENKYRHGWLNWMQQRHSLCFRSRSIHAVLTRRSSRPIGPAPKRKGRSFKETPWWRPKGGLRQKRGAADRLKQQHERRQHCESRSRLRFPPSVHLLSVNRRTMRVERKYLAPLLFHGPVLKYKYMLGPSFLTWANMSDQSIKKESTGFFYSVFVDWLHCDRVTIVVGRVHHCPCCFLTNV